MYEGMETDLVDLSRVENVFVFALCNQGGVRSPKNLALRLAAIQDEISVVLHHKSRVRVLARSLAVPNS